MASLIKRNFHYFEGRILSKKENTIWNGFLSRLPSMAWSVLEADMRRNGEGERAE